MFCTAEHGACCNDPLNICQEAQNMKIPELLDMAKEAQGFTTDMALAKGLGVSRSAVSSWRHGVSTPDTIQCATLAGYTGLPLAKVLGIVGEVRAISREEKAVWRKLAATAMAVFLMFGMIGTPGASAENVLSNQSVTNSNIADSVYYVKVGLALLGLRTPLVVRHWPEASHLPANHSASVIQVARLPRSNGEAITWNAKSPRSAKRRI